MGPVTHDQVKLKFAPLLNEQPTLKVWILVTNYENVPYAYKYLHISR